MQSRSSRSVQWWLEGRTRPSSARLRSIGATLSSAIVIIHIAVVHTGHFALIGISHGGYSLVPLSLRDNRSRRLWRCATFHSWDLGAMISKLSFLPSSRDLGHEHAPI